MSGSRKAACPFCGGPASSATVSCASCGAERLPGFGERWFLPLTILSALLLFGAQVFVLHALAERLQPEPPLVRASRVATVGAALGSALLTRLGGRAWTDFLLAPRRRDRWSLGRDIRRGG
ncbi:hypothetical protein [Neomegalonema sp.]|uniref:hypothetical protein n=1 Tax=Neomegalonema sp. TaxID=2039713 RepID=UPI0026141AB7|nr:hypothetical protein [Neomegalonema sp.]MDD2868278.1 hypothetical protein [Neomegalonema sp.]